MIKKRTPQILFVATQHENHPRVEQMLSALRANFEVTSVTSAAPNYWLRVVILLVRLVFLSRQKFDVVFVGFLPQAILPFLGKHKNKAIVSDVFYSLYDTVIADREIFGRSSFIAKICSWLDWKTLQISDLVITDTLAHSQFFSTNYDLPMEIFRRISISAGKDYCESRIPEITLKDDEICNLLFVGNFIPLQGVEYILRAADLLDRGKYRFTLVGSGQTLAKSKNIAEKFKLDNVCFCGPLATGEILKIAERTHIILGIFGTSAKAQRVIPHKVFEALALGKPLITEQSPAVAELFVDQRDILLVSPGDPQRLAEKIIWVRQNYDLAKEIGRTGQETFQRRAHPKIIADELRKILMGLH